jgi:glycosyltransferase involved in cell wall biosynthesis
MTSGSVSLLTGGSDKPYAIGLASALAAEGIAVDFVGSDELDCPEVRQIPQLTFLNLRGDQREDAPMTAKVSRLVTYYARLLRYAATARPRILHILWNNKFELFDRTVLMTYYRLVGKRVVMTAHNVNMAARNGTDTWLNRASLRIQYRLCDHIFVHTDAMKRQLVADFDVPEDRVTVIPFGINDTVPKSDLTVEAARRSFGIEPRERTLLFFGQIAPYKGLEYLIEAVAQLARRGERIRLIIGGKVKRGSEDYWSGIARRIHELDLEGAVVQQIGFIPDELVEPYFKAADAVVIPYVAIFQSGVPFLAFSFGRPVIATDVGSLREDVTADTGRLCKARDAADLARAISAFYASRLFLDTENVRPKIRRIADERHSWSIVAARTTAVYDGVTRKPLPASAVASTPAPQRASSKCQE